MTYLIAHGAQINSRDKLGISPLAIAARQSSVAAAEALLELGADIYIKDHKDHTPAMIAAMKGDTTLVQLLVSKESTMDHLP